jgi:5-oxoprolinase (ATP-hydrolysing) subunit A
LNAFLSINGTKLHHVKPHGALYNMAAKDAVIAKAICTAVKDYDADLILYGLSGSELIHNANAIALRNGNEVFADRTYQQDGTLTARSFADAMIDDEEKSIRQVLQVIQNGTVTTTSGQSIKITAQTICIHSDGKNALALAKRIHDTLNQKTIEIKPV